MFKGIAGQKLLVFAFSRVTAEPVLGDAANITCKVALDNGTATALTDVNPVETEDGRYLFDLTQAETNGNTIDFYPESSTADVQVIAINHDRQSVPWDGSTPTPGPTPDPGGLAASWVEYYGGGVGVLTDANQVLRITRNDTYTRIAFEFPSDISGYTGLLTIRHRVTGAQLMQVVATAVSATTIEADLTSADTAFPLLVALSEFGPHPFDIQMTTGSTTVTPISGIAVVRKDQTT